MDMSNEHDLEKGAVRIKHTCGRAAGWRQSPMAWWARCCGVFREDVSPLFRLSLPGIISLAPDTVRVRPFLGHSKVSDFQIPITALAAGVVSLLAVWPG